MSHGIYLDHHASTPLDPRVLEKMMPYLTGVYGNPSSIDHAHGHAGHQAVETAREDIARLLGCARSREIIFTSGATESNNLALTGVFRKYRHKGNHIISSVIEHPAVLETLEHLKEEGAEITLVPVDRYGMVSPDDIAAAIKASTILISIMYANNEIGTIQPVHEIGKISRERGILFHSDAAQAVGHEGIDPGAGGIDLLSFSAHKFYGPMGVGGLYLRSFSPMVRPAPLLHGGGHEKGFRSGTLNLPGIVGMAEALKIARQLGEGEKERLRVIRGELLGGLCVGLGVGVVYGGDCVGDIEGECIRVNGHPESRLSHNLSLTLPGVESRALLHRLRGRLSLSLGSACSAARVRPSYVLGALGLSEDEIHRTIRIGLGRNVTEKNCGQIIDLLVEGIRGSSFHQ